MARCDSYLQHGLTHKCYSALIPAECSCGGDTNKCNFFPEKWRPKPPEPMDELKKRLAEACERKLDYYDIVNESAEQVEYGLLIDFLFEQIAELMRGEGK